jgi:hypothetical protein
MNNLHHVTLLDFGHELHKTAISKKKMRGYEQSSSVSIPKKT